MRYLVYTDWVIHYLNGHPAIVAYIKGPQCGWHRPIFHLACRAIRDIFYARDRRRIEEGLQVSWHVTRLSFCRKFGMAEVAKALIEREVKKSTFDK